MHATAAANVPFAWQVCCALVVAHCVELGVHMPAQTPLTHAWLTQGTGVSNVPVLLQVCVALLLAHSTVPGEHVPVHAPPTHAMLLQGTAPPKRPFAPQVCTPLPEQRVSLGPHSPAQAVPTHV
jgi:hypothetical protein